jgi:hypothetical protein
VDARLVRKVFKDSSSAGRESEDDAGFGEKVKASKCYSIDNSSSLDSFEASSA